MIHVWSDKSLGKGFSGKYFVYMAYVRGAPAETLTELDCRLLSHDFKNV